MGNLTLNTIGIRKWFKDRGDYTHNINYDLNEDSKVIDIGGYTGVWSQQIIDKYNPNMYIIEPVPMFFDTLIDKFGDNPKVHLLNVGVSTRNKKGKLYMSGDGTSSNFNNEHPIDIKYRTIEHILWRWNLDKVDLIQINIEGDEYPLLTYMIKRGLLKYFKNIQVQFHLGINDAKVKRRYIRKGLKKNNFKIKFDYPFVWESWCKDE